MKDMTKGSPIRLILGFAIPLFFGMLFQQFYNLVDMIIVGRFLGASALAAVGATGSINFMIIGFCMGVCNGFAIPVAQKFGAKDEKQLRYYVANSVWLSIIFAVVMTVTVSLLCRNILVWMDTPEDILDASYAYIIVIFIGIPVTYLYNLLSGIMRSLGDSKSPLSGDFVRVKYCFRYHRHRRNASWCGRCGRCNCPGTGNLRRMLLDLSDQKVPDPPRAW